MGKINDALVGIKGIPDDIIQLQEGRELKIVTDKTVAEAFATKDEAVLRDVFDLIGGTAVRSSMKTEVALALMGKVLADAEKAGKDAAHDDLAASLAASLAA
jgi:hypothetical protein